MKFSEIGDGGNSQVIFILIIGLLALGLITFIISRLFKRERETPLFTPEEECCGAHEICEKESLLNTTTEIEYYEDEELDRFKGMQSADYSAEEEEEFREILLTLKDDEVAGWLKSLQLREITPPDPIKEEALLIIRERRFPNQ